MRRRFLPYFLVLPLLAGCAPRAASLLPTVPVTIPKEGPEAARPLPAPPPPRPPAPPAAAPGAADNGAKPLPATAPPPGARPATDNGALPPTAAADNAAKPLPAAAPPPGARPATDNGAPIRAAAADNAAKPRPATAPPPGARPATDNGALPPTAAADNAAKPRPAAAPPPGARPATDNGAPIPAAAADNAAIPAPPPPPDPVEVHRKTYERAIEATREALGRKEPLKAVPAWPPLMGTPWEREARFNLAVLYHLAGDVKEAEGRYRPLVEADPPHEGAAANLLGLLLMQGRRDEGVALAERLFPPGRPVAAAALPELAGNAAALLLDAGKADAAAPLLAPGAFRGTAPPSAAWNRAVLAWKLGDGAGARSASAAVTPATAALWAVKASRPEWDRADLDRRIDGLEPPPRDDRRLLASSRILSAWEAWRKGDGDGAERLLRQASPDRPDEADAGLGLLLAEKGRWKEARTILEALTKRRPALPEGWLNLGIYRELYEGNGAGALECYRRYVNLGGSRKDEVGKWIEWLERSPSR